MEMLKNNKINEENHDDCSNQKVSIFGFEFNNINLLTEVFNIDNSIAYSVIFNKNNHAENVLMALSDTNKDQVLKKCYQIRLIDFFLYKQPSVTIRR